jgi:surface polysaccharide O-acyltransferase-like enzyme
MLDRASNSANLIVPDLTPLRRSDSRSRASFALANLRAFVILIVLAFHSMLAYVSWIPSTAAGFDSPPYRWRAFPIVDSQRWFGFDLFCAWQDVYLMSLMFFLSGLFVWSSLTRKKEWTFFRDRVLRLGLPYVVGIAIIIPLAIYPAYRITTADASVLGYWHALLALPFWPNGPLWFLWQLLVLNTIAAALHWIAPNALTSLGRRSATAEKNFGRYFAGLVVVSALAYIPLAIIFTPWTWSNYTIFTVQLCRPLHYAVYFFAGVGIGMAGIERGLLTSDGVLARHWALWLVASLASLLLWMELTALTMNGGSSLAMEIAADFSFVLACAAGCFFLIVVSVRFAASHSEVLDSLSTNAYGLYLVHYGFVVWLQYALLAMALSAVLKAAIVFGGTLILSWITTLAVQRIPLGARLIGVPRRAVATS